MAPNIAAQMRRTYVKGLTYETLDKNNMPGILYINIYLRQQAVLAQTTAETARGNCKAAAEACQKTIDYCTTKGGKYAEAM